MSHVVESLFGYKLLIGLLLLLWMLSDGPGKLTVIQEYIFSTNSSHSMHMLVMPNGREGRSVRETR